MGLGIPSGLGGGGGGGNITNAIHEVERGPSCHVMYCVFTVVWMGTFNTEFNACTFTSRHNTVELVLLNTMQLSYLN